MSEVEVLSGGRELRDTGLRSGAFKMVHGFGPRKPTGTQELVSTTE